MTASVPGPAPPAAAFDRVAPWYDRDFTDTALGGLLRRRVWRHLDDAFAPADEVLELGCGTGADALHLAARGIRVTATDASAAMLEVAGAKAAAAAREGAIRFRQIDLGATPISLPAPSSGDLYDGAFSDFGALNCVGDRRAAGAAMAARLRPGAPVVLVLMGPFCPLEIIGFLLAGRPGSAFRRWRPGRPATLGGGSLPVWYPSPRALRRELAPWFRAVHAQALGVALPPTDLGRRLVARPRLLAALGRLDAALEAAPLAPWLADHYLLRLERRQEPE